MLYDKFVLVLTEHAREQMFNRGIDEEQIRRVIIRGSKVKQTDGFKSVYTYLGVSYRIVGEKLVIKTVTIE